MTVYAANRPKHHRQTPSMATKKRPYTLASDLFCFALDQLEFVSPQLETFQPIVVLLYDDLDTQNGRKGCDSSTAIDWKVSSVQSSTKCNVSV